MLFVSSNIVAYIFATVFLIAMIKISRVPFKFIFRGLKAIFMILFISVFFNVFFTSGRVVFSCGIIKVTYEGLVKAGLMGYRFVLLIVGSSLLTLTTTPNNLTDGLEKSLGFLKKVRIPVHEIAMMMSIALRFIPILMEETDKIMKAQTARGADFETGNILRRAKSMIPILVPLFVSSFRRANDLAIAMDARCYKGGEGRTKMKPLKYNTMDYVGYIIVISYVMIMTILKIMYAKIM
jgi:energy-coupling factor transport system permease protein